MYIERVKLKFLDTILQQLFEVITPKDFDKFYTQSEGI